MVLKAEGAVAPGFERVRDEFERNFAERGEVGAAFAAVRDGETVVDLWGGLADQAAQRAWQEDTLQLIFSGTKGVVAACLLMLIDRGLIDPNAPVARYWPEFAGAGKDDIRVSDVASHQAGLPGLRAPVVESDLIDDVRMAAALAAQPAEEDPRARDAYHPLTFGWLCGELIRRVDGRSVGRFLAEEIVAPLGLEIWIGLPEHLEERVSTLSYAPDWGVSLPDAAQLASDELAARVWANPPLFPAEHLPWNTRAFHAAEIPGAGGIATARSIARLYGCLARGGELDGVRLLSARTLERGRACLVRRTDSLQDELSAFGLGFELQTELLRLGPPTEAFGHTGAGGSCHGAWPQARAGFSYCMNRMVDRDPVDARAQALLRALYEAL
jgi:CubicO group peptidase (beta-lactamase class C family)